MRDKGEILRRQCERGNPRLLSAQLINDDVLATQLQLPLRHLVLSVFHPFGSLALFLSASIPVSLFLFLSLSLGLQPRSKDRALWKLMPAQPPHPIYTTLFHPRFSLPPSTSCSRSPPSFSPAHRVTGYTALVHLERPTTRVIPRIQFRATCVPTFSLPPLSPSPILLIGGPRYGLSITGSPEGESTTPDGIKIFLVELRYVSRICLNIF